MFTVTNLIGEAYATKTSELRYRLAQTRNISGFLSQRGLPVESGEILSMDDVSRHHSPILRWTCWRGGPSPGEGSSWSRTGAISLPWSLLRVAQVVSGFILAYYLTFTSMHFIFIHKNMSDK